MTETRRYKTGPEPAEGTPMTGIKYLFANGKIWYGSGTTEPLEPAYDEKNRRLLIRQGNSEWGILCHAETKEPVDFPPPPEWVKRI